MKIKNVYCDSNNHTIKFIDMKQREKGYFKDENNNKIHFIKYRCPDLTCSNKVIIHITHKGTIKEGLK